MCCISLCLLHHFYDDDDDDDDDDDAVKPEVLCGVSGQRALRPVLIRRHGIRHSLYTVAVQHRETSSSTYNLGTLSLITSPSVLLSMYEISPRLLHYQHRHCHQSPRCFKLNEI